MVHAHDYKWTIKNEKTEIHFVLEQQMSYLTAIPDHMLSNTLLPNNTIMAYHKGNQYCKRMKVAKVDMCNVRHIKQKAYDQCYKYHNNTNTCTRTQDPQCKYAVGSSELAMQKHGILPDLKNKKPSIAFANACFLPSNYTKYGNFTQIQEIPRTKRKVTLAVVALISVLVGALLASIIPVQMKTYNDMVDDKLEDLESRFTLQLNQVEDQVTKLQAQELELANVIVTLSRVTANLANRQQRFENFMFSFNRQLLEQQIITMRRSIENRKLIMSQNAREAQRSIEEYNSRKLILQTLKALKNIPLLRNDTIYRNQIAKGIIHST